MPYFDPRYFDSGFFGTGEGASHLFDPRYFDPRYFDTGQPAGNTATTALVLESAASGSSARHGSAECSLSLGSRVRGHKRAAQSRRRGGMLVRRVTFPERRSGSATTRLVLATSASGHKSGLGIAALRLDVAWTSDGIASRRGMARAVFALDSAASGVLLLRRTVDEEILLLAGVL